MLQQGTTDYQILEVVRAHPDCTLEEVTQKLPTLHWSDVFVAVEFLSRSGHLRLTQRDLELTTTLSLP